MAFAMQGVKTGRYNMVYGGGRDMSICYSAKKFQGSVIHSQPITEAQTLWEKALDYMTMHLERMYCDSCVRDEHTVSLSLVFSDSFVVHRQSPVLLVRHGGSSDTFDLSWVGYDNDVSVPLLGKEGKPWDYAPRLLSLASRFIEGVHLLDAHIPSTPQSAPLIEGWRTFTLLGGRTYSPPSVTPPTLVGAFSQVWLEREMHAQCFCAEPDSTGAPVSFGQPPTQERLLKHLARRDWTCGIYVQTKEAFDRNMYGASPQAVRARVVGWGAAFEYEDGWRAEYVRIEELYIPHDHLAFKEGLEERYKVPVTVLPSLPKPVITDEFLFVTV